MDGIDNILALSAQHEIETSALTRDSLTKMLREAFHSASAGEGRDGYVIGFDQDADYDSVNFLWFKNRYARFVYIDRVVVAEAARGRGIARAFYDNLCAHARDAGHTQIVCEINLDPPNPRSMAFHAAMGFTEAGEAWLPNGKRVSYQLYAL
jgi:uncharacterized protein